ncbi:4Fe-4S dicluster domain-containing protein [bacterium]|nr:4Fe-4S dicluster domain-containing protein [bacterium]
MVTTTVEKIRELSAQLLKDKKVDMVIGFQKGSLPMSNEPVMVKRPADVDKLVWDSHCSVNLASYLTDRKEKIGVIAKGCDTRNIATHIIENKISREQLTIIGVPCSGMIDRRKVMNAVGFEIKELIEESDRVIAKGDDAEKRFNKAEILQENCAVCSHPNPVLFDELVSDPVEVKEGIDRYADVREIEAMETDAKWAYFEDLLSNCIRCYACRNACPLCYCPTCFVDESEPQWVGKSSDAVDTRTFHFLRAYHCAGRCTDCGSCERVCPMGIKMRAFTRKLEKDCLESFNWQAGLNIEQRPPLDSFNPADPDQFVK